MVPGRETSCGHRALQALCPLLRKLFYTPSSRTTPSHPLVSFLCQPSPRGGPPRLPASCTSLASDSSQGVGAGGQLDLAQSSIVLEGSLAKPHQLVPSVLTPTQLWAALVLKQLVLGDNLRTWSP